MRTEIQDERPPVGIRLLSALGKEPDWSAMTDDKLVAFRNAENRKRASRLARLITGLPDRGAMIGWEDVAMADRDIRVRVYRPSATRNGAGTNQANLPLVMHVHGGGFVGTAVQSDWVNSHLAARLPAVVVSVEHRLLTTDIPLSAAVDDGSDVLERVTEDAPDWGIDVARAAVFGESAGAAISALVAIRSREAGRALRAQVLVNPCVDLTSTMYDYDSMSRYGDSPTLTTAQMQFFHRLAVPPETDPRRLSPIHAADLSGLPPTLVVVPTFDPLADQGRCYVARLWEAGTPARAAEYRGATHAFLSMPGLVRQAKAARAEILEFLRCQLA
jgi:acetyl esterase